jgi:paraquat-inducible protein B
MTDAHADISQKKRLSPVWIVPIVALLIGIWMLVYTLQSEGPTVTIVFSTAEGIEDGKTKIKFRNVDIGLVETAGLGEDLESVVVVAQIEKEAAPLLREDTQFWVVRPRIGKGGVSGLGTLLSGGYIQVAPGTSDKRRTDFVGLEEPPVTPAGSPGLRLNLVADRAGSVSVGDPILYEGYTVGAVETEAFHPETKDMHYEIFIEAPYDRYVNTSTRFWDVSGISVSAGAEGIEAQVGSLESLVVGGVQVGLPEGMLPGAAVESGDSFRLYESFAAVNQRPHRHSIEYVVAFSQSVRGLLPGAPVEFRGLPVGQVERVMLTEFTRGGLTGKDRPIPVLITLTPARLELPDSEAGVENLREAIDIAIASLGLRATLATGNLLTGSLYVSLDHYPDAPKAENGQFGARPMIPSIESGLGGIEQRITVLLDRLNELPLDETVTELQGTLASINKILASDAMQSLPAGLEATLEELKGTLASFSGDSELQERMLPTIGELERTLASLRQVLDTLEAQPNALLFNRDHREDPRPPAGNP